jgi:site-specific DNA-methyltransferase (adenine-specific)
MGKYSCEKCAKSFSQKSHYDKHISRKNPCEIQTDKIKALIDKAVDKKLIELNIKLNVNNSENNITMNITEKMDISKMSKIDLLEKCKELDITKCSSKNKSQLIELINSNHKTNNNNTEKYKNGLINEVVINEPITETLNENPMTEIRFDIKSMRYLGNKSKHLEFIYSALNECCILINNNNPIIFDAFGGTGTVSQFLNINGYQTVSNDINDYSYKLCYCRNSITKDDIPFCGLGGNIESIVTILNACRHKGFVYYNYSPNVEFKFERKYFTNSNAEIIDGIRMQIEEWYTNKQITTNEHIFLVALLVETVSLYSNIPGTYGAFNANWDSRSIRTFMLDKEMVDNLLAKNKHTTCNNDVREVISGINCDILYLDPPYNERDYSMYYHVLETISLYNNPALNDNKTGTKKEYKRSKWCTKKDCISELEYVITNTTAKCVIMSYNNEGIMNIAEIESLFKKYGTYSVKTKIAKRFKCNDTAKSVIVNEYLHILIKNDYKNVNAPENISITTESHAVMPPISKSSFDTVEFNKIYNCCCIDGMKQLPSNIIDLICVDLPYGLTECKWDTPINIDELWKEYKRILKPYGTIVLFGQQPFTSRLVSSNYDMFKYSLVWQKSKPGGFAQAPYKVLCEHEDILIFSYGKTAENAKHKMIYNPQGTIPCNKQMKGKTGATEHRGNRKTQNDYVQTTSNYPRSVLKFNNEGKTQHPTQKPVELIKYLINTFSNKNSIVLDSCLGSGTTAIACLETNRRFIGYELEKKYFDISTERIAKLTYKE